MQERRTHTPSLRGWIVMALLAVIAACLLATVVSDHAGAQSSSGQRGNVFAVCGQITSDTYGVYLVDLEHGTMCVYRYDPHSKRLGLLAARTYVYDVMLDDYNSGDPAPRDVKEMVQRQRRLTEAPPSPATNP